jgi:uncharacterized DUF497 family protein
MASRLGSKNIVPACTIDTYRGDAMRVISFRRANSREIKRYADEKNRRGVSAR